ncbi:MAG: type III-B CRISPR module-associated protein Cmr5 [Venatoribacter sp.]
MRIRTHRYAEAAFPLVEKLQKDPIEAKYRTLALSFPAMIMQAGLMQAVGFLKAKDEAEHKELLRHIEGIIDAKDLHALLLKSDVQEYQLLTRKALDASSWLKRYTQALLEKNRG